MTAPAPVSDGVLPHVYEPRGTQRRLFVASEGGRSTEVVLSGPAGTGKSRACLEKIHLCMKRWPGARALLLRQVKASLTSTGLVTWREHVADQDLASGEVTWYGGSDQEPPQYRYANGSRVMVGGLDDPLKIMSSEYDMIYVQEATELSVVGWESASTRLRNGIMPFQQLIADCNPDAPTHWLKRRCDEGKTLMIHTRHEDNPRLYRDDQWTDEGLHYMARLDALTGIRLQRLRYGRWVAAEGTIYSDWSEAVHLVERAPIPNDWPRLWSVDFGYTNPFVLQCWAIDPDDRLVMYRELYMTGRTVDEHAADILRQVTSAAHDGWGTKRGVWTEPKPRMVICDHDSGDRATLQRELGLPCAKAIKSVVPGIQAVQRRLRLRKDGTPGLMIMKDSRVEVDTSLRDAGKPTCTAEEIPGYVQDPRAARGHDRSAHEEPLKENDHGCDALRYLVAEREIRSRPGVRFM